VAIYLTLCIWAAGMLVLAMVIRYAIDSSKTSRKLDLLADEIRMLRRELKEKPHHIDTQI
jgi:hypothetical protein